MKKILLLSIVLFMMEGCYKTIITNGISEQVVSEQYASWHHNMILSLVEISDPVKLKKVCPKGWAAIKTHQSFLNGLTKVFVGMFYSPQTVSVSCK